MARAARPRAEPRAAAASRRTNSGLATRFRTSLDREREPFHRVVGDGHGSPTPCGAAFVSRAVAPRGGLCLGRPRAPSEPLAGPGRSASACCLGRVSVPGLGSSGRASTAPFAWHGFRLLVCVRFRAPSCRHSLLRFRARAFPVGVPALVAPTLRSPRSGCLFRGFIPPRSGACSSQATASLPLTRLRSPALAGCHGAPPRLRGFVPRGDRSTSTGVTRPRPRFPSSGSLPWVLPLSVPGCPGPPMTLSRRPSQALTVRDRLRRLAVTGGWLAVSGPPTHSRFEAVRRLALATWASSRFDRRSGNRAARRFRL